MLVYTDENISFLVDILNIIQWQTILIIFHLFSIQFQILIQFSSNFQKGTVLHNFK